MTHDLFGLFRRLVGLVLVCGAFSASTASESGQWQDLFNGKNLSGWVVVHDAKFEVHDGNLRLVTGNGWLRTEKEYTDFILELEWRALQPYYDSGVLLRAPLKGKPWPDEVWQVNLAADALGGLVQGYSPVVRAKTRRKPVNQWVKFRLEVRGTRLALDVDGQRSWEFDELDRAKGYIGIQAENKSFEFRNIRIREIGST